MLHADKSFLELDVHFVMPRRRNQESRATEVSHDIGAGAKIDVSNTRQPRKHKIPNNRNSKSKQTVDQVIETPKELKIDSNSDSDVIELTESISENLSITKVDAPEPISLPLLLRICNVDDEESLMSIHELRISVDTKKHGPCDEIGYLLKKLKYLYFENSALASMRDLGTSMRFLRVLKAPHCGLTELDGVSALFSLEELYVAFNEIEDLSAISLHDSLQVLDIEANNVKDILQIAQLGTCTALWSLTLTGCPILRLCASRVNYRRVVYMHIQSLQFLDDEPITPTDREDPDTRALSRRQRPSSVPSPHKAFDIKDFNSDQNFCEASVDVEEVDADSDMVRESIKMFRPHRDTFDDEDMCFTRTARPFTTGSLHDNEVFSLLHHSREVSAISAQSVVVTESLDRGMPSLLTHGDSDLFSGNAIRGLRHRYRKPLQVDQPSDAPDNEVEISNEVTNSSESVIGQDPLDIESESIALRALRKRAAQSSPTTRDTPPQPSIDNRAELDEPFLTQSVSTRAGMGAANLLTDVAVVSLLRMRPKDVPQLKTRSGFQRFFYGMDRAKLKRLLHEAYRDLDPEASETKVNKRLLLFGDK